MAPQYRKNNPPQQRIACINMGGIGDNFLFAPVIQALQGAYHSSHITFIVEHRSASAATVMAGVHDTLTLNLQGFGPGLSGKFKAFQALKTLLTQGQFDVVVSSGRSPLIAVLLALSGITTRVGYNTSLLSRWLLTHPAPLNTQQYAAQMYFSLAEALLGKAPARKALGLGVAEPLIPQLHPATAECLMWAEGCLGPQLSGKKRILIHPGVSRVSLQKGIYKTWPAESWVKLIDALSHQHQVYLVGGPDDETTIQDIQAALAQQGKPTSTHFKNLAGQTKNLADLLALVQQANLLISVDSAPLHLAIGCKTPVVCIFGPTNEHKLVPNVDWVTPVSVDELICRPCLWDVRQTSCITPICLDVPVEKIMQIVDQQLA
jgi:putative inorganic carbon (HCO3(-)) transporter